jgi:hypothetical protein
MSAYGFARRPVSEASASSGTFFRLGLATLLFLLLPVAAEAYTLVLRSGRHVTVPEDFKVTPAAVTYEASPGFNVTVWLSNVDFAATERANAEPEGSFAARVKRAAEGAAATPARAPGVVQTGRRSGRRVITNRELEPSRLKREAQEEEYERTRRERGMPSREELRQRFEEQERRLRELARQAEAERAEAEMESLRSELANVRRHLSELNFQLSQRAAAYAPVYATPDYYPYYYAPPSHVITVLPFGHRGRFGHGNFGPHPHARRWHGSGLRGHLTPVYVGPSRNAGALPSAMSAPRRGR